MLKKFARPWAPLIVCLSLVFISFAIAQPKSIEPSLPKLTSVDIGNIKPGTTTLTNNGKGLKLVGYGTMFGMHTNSDQVVLPTRS